MRNNIIIFFNVVYSNQGFYMCVKIIFINILHLKIKGKYCVTTFIPNIFISFIENMNYHKKG